MIRNEMYEEVKNVRQRERECVARPWKKKIQNDKATLCVCISKINFQNVKNFNKKKLFPEFNLCIPESNFRNAYICTSEIKFW